MIDIENLRVDGSIAKMLYRAVGIFERTGLPELAEKWEKILNNYIRAKSIR